MKPRVACNREQQAAEHGGHGGSRVEPGRCRKKRGERTPATAVPQRLFRARYRQPSTLTPTSSSMAGVMGPSAGSSSSESPCSAGRTAAGRTFWSGWGAAQGRGARWQQGRWRRRQQGRPWACRRRCLVHVCAPQTCATLSKMTTSRRSARRRSREGPHMDMVPPYLQGPGARGWSALGHGPAKTSPMREVPLSPHQQEKRCGVRRCACREPAVGDPVVANRHVAELAEEAQICDLAVRRDPRAVGCHVKGLGRGSTSCGCTEERRRRRSGGRGRLAGLARQARIAGTLYLVRCGWRSPLGLCKQGL